MDTPNLAIYSTYCGTNKNATFKQAPAGNYPRYFISNNQEVLDVVAELGWTPLFLEGHTVVDNLIISATQAKIAKVLPHLFPELDSYDFLFYVDDKVALDETLIPDLVTALTTSNASTAMKRHPFLDANVLSEYTESLQQPRYYAQRALMAKYIADQAAAGWLLEAELHFTTACILRDMRHPDTMLINEEWFAHIQRCGIECQISFFFIARQFPNIMVLPDNVFS